MLQEKKSEKFIKRNNTDRKSENMSYEAIICKLKNVRPHPNADRLQLAEAANFTVIVGLTNKEGDLGVFFGPDGKLSEKHLYENNLFTHPNLNKDTEKKGYFDDNGRVKIRRLRGIISEGFWQEASAFDWCGGLKLKENQTFQSLNGITICEKYYSARTLKAIEEKNKQKRNLWKRWKKLPLKLKIIKFFPFLLVVTKEYFTTKEKRDFKQFNQHYDTKQLRHNLSLIPEGALIYFSQKLHGTSQRCIKMYVKKKYSGPFSFFKRLFSRPKIQLVSGTRRTVMNIDNIKSSENFKDGYYSGSTFREDIHNRMKDLPIHLNETIYFEVVGYQDNMSPIMGVYHTDDKEISKRYGKDIVFSYGCSPVKENQYGNAYKIFVYRITMTNEDGIEVEYSWPQIEQRCKELNLNTVPVLDRFFFTTAEELLKRCKPLLDRPDVLDNRHPTEGIVIRVESGDLRSVYKIKSVDFAFLENIRNNLDLFDFEDMS